MSGKATGQLRNHDFNRGLAKAKSPILLISPRCQYTTR